MTSIGEITGTILAGGLSRRMFDSAGGTGDKGLLALGNDTMIGRVIACVGPQVSALVLNGNGDAARFAALRLPVVADPIEGFVGPLAGVLAGMRWTASQHPRASHTLTVSSDAPFLPDDLVQRLAAALADQPRCIAIAKSANGLHPVIGLWPVALADDLEAALRAGVRKVLAWTDRHGTIAVTFDDVRVGTVAVDPFFNANTAAELDEARSLVAAMGT